MTSRMIAAVAVGAVALIAAASPAQGPTPAQQVTARQAGFKQMGAAFKTIRDGVAGGSPNTPAVAAAARRLALLSHQLPRWFPAGSGPQAASTAAKADVWTNGAAFAAQAAGLQRSARTLDAAARGGDAGAIEAAFRDTGARCSSCHRVFRAER